MIFIIQLLMPKLGLNCRSWLPHTRCHTLTLGTVPYALWVVGSHPTPTEGNTATLKRRQGARAPGERERDVTNAVRYLLSLGGMSSGIQAIWPPRVAVLFQFGRALLRNQRALSGKPMFWQPYRCTTPGCWPRGIAGVMDLLSAGGTT